MQKRKGIAALAIMIFGVSMIVFFAYLGAKKTTEHSSRSPEPSVTDSGEAISGHEGKIRPPSPDDQELFSLAREIRKFTDAELNEEELSLTAKLSADDNDLIKRMNLDLVSEEERLMAKAILLRLALVRVEKSKRGLKLHIKKGKAESMTMDSTNP